MSTRTVLVCDVCGKEENWSDHRKGWRRLYAVEDDDDEGIVDESINLESPDCSHHIYDLCSNSCREKMILDWFRKRKIIDYERPSIT